MKTVDEIYKQFKLTGPQKHVVYNLHEHSDAYIISSWYDTKNMYRGDKHHCCVGGRTFRKLVDLKVIVKEGVMRGCDYYVLNCDL